MVPCPNRRPGRGHRVVVACTSPATADLAAARGLPMLLGLHMTDEQKAAMIQRCAATAHAAGHDPAGVDHVSAMLAHTAETREQARSDFRTALPGWLADGLAGYRPADGKPHQPRDPLAYADFLSDVHGDCSKIGVSGPTRRAEVRRDGHCE
ncbi:LLM class flavin-dependent oxidoreductase [Amycolatopsis sp. NPDC058278]|uniref:LLM class flavin-dependent oxidoreductase n=1 Tax=Amycolatopsis sp. NPDC058278 TaxID=3346417 RepID=UPI0036D7EF03